MRSIAPSTAIPKPILTQKPIKMGSILSRAAELEQSEIDLIEQQEFADQLAQLHEVKPNSEAQRNWLWLFRNRDKIFRNQRLINLLG